jgi:hypothetical protein
VTLRNTSGTRYPGPLALVVNLPPAAQSQGVSLLGAVINNTSVAARRTGDGRWYVEAIPVGGVLNPNQSLSITLTFSANPQTDTASVLPRL